MFVKKRNVPLALVLSVVTCGLYGLYWMASLTKDIQELSGEKKTASGGIAALFTVLTCTLYSYYWFYKVGGSLVEARRSRGLSLDSVSNMTYAVTTVVLTVLGILWSICTQVGDYLGAMEQGEDPMVVIGVIGVSLAASICFSIFTACVLLYIVYRRADENPRIVYILMAILRTNLFTIAFLQASVNDLLAQDELAVGGENGK